MIRKLAAATCLLRDVLRCRFGRDFDGASARACRLVADLHWATGGRSTRWLRRVVDGGAHAAAAPAEAEPPTGPLAAECEEAARSLDEHGVYVFRERIDAAHCGALRALAERVPCRVFAADGAFGGQQRYEPGAPAWPSYHLPLDALLADPHAQYLLALDAPRRAAAGYFGRPAFLQNPEAWWNTAAGQGPNAFQRFHFDAPCAVGRPLRWVRFFVYLDDVGPGHGPHVYVRGSHRPWRRLRGRLRFEYGDDEVAGMFGNDRALEITGSAGTAFLVDTLGLHKAGLPRDGDRLVFEYQLSGTRFDPVAAPLLVPEPTPELADAARRGPFAYRRFQLAQA